MLERQKMRFEFWTAEHWRNIMDLAMMPTHLIFLRLKALQHLVQIVLKVIFQGL